MKNPVQVIIEAVEANKKELVSQGKTYSLEGMFVKDNGEYGKTLCFPGVVTNMPETATLKNSNGTLFGICQVTHEIGFMKPFVKTAQVWENSFKNFDNGSECTIECSEEMTAGKINARISLPGDTRTVFNLFGDLVENVEAPEKVINVE